MKSCPVSAITMDEHGVCQIDESKCIQCGQCIHNCPFGAIASKTSIVDVINEIRAGKKVVTMLAPAGEGQFGENITMASLRFFVSRLPAEPNTAIIAFPSGVILLANSKTFSIPSGV